MRGEIFFVYMLQGGPTVYSFVPVNRKNQLFEWRRGMFLGPNCLVGWSVLEIFVSSIESESASIRGGSDHGAYSITQAIVKW